MIAKYAIALLVVILLAAAFAWAFLPARYLPGNRARHLRIRLHLRLHPGKGFAHIFSLWLRWGRLAVLRRSGRIRSALPLRYRIAEPRQHSVFLGRAHYRHALRVPLEEHLLVMAPPRTYKTAFLADVILRYPGPVIATTTKADIYHLTSAVRAQHGRVHVFNPQHIGGVASTFCWDPVAGCEDPATAIRRADAFAFAVSQKGVEDGTFWSAKASDYLRGYFCAAALARYDLRTVAAWVAGADPDVPERILLAAGARQWAHTLAELRSEAHKTAATVRMVMSRSLAFMADPALAASVLPGSGDGFDIPSFLEGTGTVYLIAEAVSEEAPVAPLFAAMASEIHYIAAQLGQASSSGRLDPPLLMGLDEVTQICPVPLPFWLSDSGGKGIQVAAVVHGEAQLASRWGDYGRQVVLDTSSVKVFLPGITDPATLQTARGTHHQAAGLGRAGLPARLRPPGRWPRPLLALPRPVPVRPGHPGRTVVSAVPAARPQPRTGLRPGRIPGPPPARPGRPAAHRDQPLRPPPRRRISRRAALEHAMTRPTLRQALEYAARGWPVFPCNTGQKTPATPHGHRDATTDPEQITAWFTRNPLWNLAIATGAPGPDVLDVDDHGPAGNGYAAFAKLTKAGLIDGAAAYVRTPSGGLHAYFRGSGQRNGHLPAHHLDFRSRGGYILAPPSWVNSKLYQLIRTLDADGELDWATVTTLLEPQRQATRHQLHPDPGRDLSHLARWVAAQAEGNRNAGLFWAANRALEADPATDLSPLAAAARQAGLEDKEILRTLDSARKTGQPRPPAPDYQAEPGDPS